MIGASATRRAGATILGTMPLFKTKDPTVPPGQSVTTGFPVLHVGNVPNFDPKTWRLRFFGLCENPYELTWDELQAEPADRVAR